MAEERQSFHMTPDEFRRWGHEAVEWVARYWETVEQHRVQSVVAPGDIAAMLPLSPPAQGEPFDDVLADLDRVILPGITHWQSPGWFAFFPANTSGPAVLGDLISSGLGVQGMLWATSPAATELETRVLDWVVELLGLPSRFLSTGPGGGVIQDSASSATLCALLAARQLAGEADIRRLRCYASAEAHSSVEKAVRIAGLAPDQLRLVAGDAAHALDARAFADAVEEDLAAGLVPFFAVASVGTTSSTAFDPVASMAEVADAHDMWLHVDAAFAGSAAVCPELRWIHDGLERADSYCFNPHKWLFTTFDCDCFYVADRSALISALSVPPEYLRNEASASGAVIDYRDWQIPLGRRFRSLKLWFVLRHYGADGLRHHVRRHVELAAGLAARIIEHPSLELAAPVPLNLICFRHADGDEATESLLAAINADGRFYLTHTRLDDRFVIRACIGQTHTEAEHVDALWSLIDANS
jgi:aromatic-L-amino-acid decarboxylase